MPDTSKKQAKSNSKGFKLEKNFRDWAIGQLETQFGTNVYVHVPQTVARRGDPDLILCFYGLFIPLELKLDGAKKDPGRERLQEYKIGEMYRAGAQFGSARVTPSTWGLVMSALWAIATERAECT